MEAHGEILEESFCTNLPKIELHAHLNGSLTRDTLKKLGCCDHSIAEYEKYTKLPASSRSLQDCFKLFKHAHNVTKTPESVCIATKCVIEDFVKDNVIYLELRTTPRAEDGMSKKEYIESVVKGIQEHEFKAVILVKLILSIDRRHSQQESRESLKIILEMKEKYPDIIKGIDLCGDPAQGYFDEALFEEARRNGLQTTIHCAEVINNEEVERILTFGPDRIGHASFLFPMEGGTHENLEIYMTKKILIECCLTSNVICGTVRSYLTHHMLPWARMVPFSICTDDKGVFGTTLSREYALYHRYFRVPLQQLWQMTYNAVAHTFASKEEKEKLKMYLDNWFLDYYVNVKFDEERECDINGERTLLDIGSLHI